MTCVYFVLCKLAVDDGLMRSASVDVTTSSPLSCDSNVTKIGHLLSGCHLHVNWQSTHRLFEVVKGLNGSEKLLYMDAS